MSLSVASSRMNNYQLIQHIKIRRALWDKTLWDRIDAAAREVMWEDVAHQMRSKKAIVKARWKNLRDSYRKLLIRMTDDNAGVTARPRWLYFRHLDFIKDIVLSTKSKVNDITLQNSEELSLEPDYSLTVDRSLSDAGEDPLSFANEINNSIATHDIKVEAELKMKSAGEMGADIINKLDPSDKLLANYPNDDDLQFLLSLYPHFKQVPMSKKLPLRMKIESLIYDEIYANGKGRNNFAFKL